MTTITLRITRGKMHPITHEPARKAVEVLSVEVEDAQGGRKRVRFEGCYPPEGFTVSQEHWARLYAPCVVA
jgi:hypothetical protein